MLCGSLASVVRKGHLPLSYLFELSLVAAQKVSRPFRALALGLGEKGSRGGGQPVVGTQGTSTRGRRTHMAVLLARSPLPARDVGVPYLARCFLPPAKFQGPFRPEIPFQPGVHLFAMDTLSEPNG